jgi:MFS family permease
MQQIVGIDAIMFYLLWVIERSGVTSELAQSAALIALGIVKMSFVLIGARLIDKEGRRPLFLKSLFGCAGSLIFVSFCISNDSSASKLLTVLGLAGYLAFFSLSIGPGAWVVVSEVFATSIRAKAVSIALFPNRVIATVMASTFLSIANAITWQGFFIALAVICVLCAAFVYFCVPETAGKSLEEMSHYFAELTNDRSILDLESEHRNKNVPYELS